MATIEKRGARWRVRVRTNGIDKSESFRTKAECLAWAAQREAEVSNQKLGRIPDNTFAEMLRKYIKEVAESKGGSRWELIRLKAILGDDLYDDTVREADPITKVNLHKTSTMNM